MAKRTQSSSVLPAFNAAWFRPVWHAVLAAIVFIGGLYALNQTEQFLISDWRFVLAAPQQPGLAPVNMQIEGTRYTSPDQVLRVFQPDFGRSLYLCPIAERRRHLLAIDWIKEASVLRIWPNRLVIRVDERTPVAFVEVAGQGGGLRGALVDADGVLLDPKRAVDLKLPLLTGLPGGETESKRRERIQLFLRMQSELGAKVDRFSEIDVSEVENLKVTQVSRNRALLLVLGNQLFQSRLETFDRYYPDIAKTQPDATSFDLRVKNRIVVIGAPGGAE